MFVTSQTPPALPTALLWQAGVWEHGTQMLMLLASCIFLNQHRYRLQSYASSKIFNYIFVTNLLSLVCRYDFFHCKVLYAPLLIRMFRQKCKFFFWTAYISWYLEKQNSIILYNKKHTLDIYSRYCAFIIYVLFDMTGSIFYRHINNNGK